MTKPSDRDIIADAAVVADANQAYGALTEGLYLAGFSFERAMARVLGLLKDGGWRKVGAGFDDVNAFVRSLQLDRFRVVADQRKEFAGRVKALQPTVSNRAIADALGVDEGTIRKGRAENSAPDARNGQRTGKGHAENSAPGASDGRRDATILVKRSEREQRREEKFRSIGKVATLSGRFSVIYADPPWQDEFGNSGRQTELHYPVMDLAAIEALPVAEISAPDAVLYLWALPHMIVAALEVMTAWGFSYRTCGTWTKDKTGLGQWLRNQTEHLLVGRRGDFPPPPESVRSSSWISSTPLGDHSVKPDDVAEMIERWFPDLPKIELFRRGLARPGWAAWGNEVVSEAAE